MSRMTLKEAVTASILSRRWRNVWTLVTILDFNRYATLNAFVNSSSRNTERSKYINWVNRVIRQHKGPVLDTFKLCFDLDKTSKSAIDNWVRFAISKKVKKLELDLMEYENGFATFRESMRSYTFPFKLFSIRQSNMATITGLRYLRILSLRSVTVSDQIVESLVLNCPLLESISLYGSNELANVKLSGQSLKLNSLEIAFCSSLKTIEIRNTNISSFRCLGDGVNFSFKTDVVTHLSCSHNYYQENMSFSHVPELGKLKEFILKIEDGKMKISLSAHPR